MVNFFSHRLDWKRRNVHSVATAAEKRQGTAVGDAKPPSIKPGPVISRQGSCQGYDTDHEKNFFGKQ